MQLEFLLNIGPTSPDSETCATLEHTTCQPATSSAAASPVSHTQAPADVWAVPMSETFGESSPGSLASLGPDGSWLKMSQGYYLARLDGSLVEFSETWPRAGTMQHGTVSLQPSLAACISGNVSTLLPTPTRSMGKRGWGISRTGQRRYSRIMQATAMQFGYRPPIWLLEEMMGFPPDFTNPEPNV